MSAVGQFAQRALSEDSKQSSVAVLPNYFFPSGLQFTSSTVRAEARRKLLLLMEQLKSLAFTR